MAALPLDVRVWVIIGPAQSGKSSTIGALASQPKQGRGGKREILLRGGGYISVWCYRQSVQEANLDIKPYLAKRNSEFQNVSGRAGGTRHNLLIALRSDVVNGLPTADRYLRDFQQAGWDIQSLVLLGIPNEYAKYATFGAPVALIDDAPAWATIDLHRNWIFGHARNHFGWA